MKTTIACFQIFVVMISACAAQSAASYDQSLIKSSEEVLEEICRIREVETHAPIQKGIKTKQEIRSYILERIDEEYQPEEVAAEARLLKRLGLIPLEMDLRGFMLDLLTEQIAGFYDPRAKTFYIADWIPPELQKPVMAHELIHALQDQQFDLEKFLSPVDENDDQSLAQASVIEGEGLLVMLAYTIGPFGGNINEVDIIELDRLQRPMVEAEYPTFARAPSYLKEMLLFPYTYGANFVQKVIQAGGWKSLDLLYHNFPESSEQILHPEKALRQPDAPSEVPALRPDGEKDLELSYENVLGEFGLYLYLRNQLGAEEAQTASEGWDGDHAAIYQDAAGRETLTLNSVWDSGRDAEEFFEAVQEALSNSFGSTITWDRQDADSGKHAIGRAGNREFRLRLDGQTVTLIDRDS